MNSSSPTYYSTKSSWDHFFILKWNDHIFTSSQGRARGTRFIFLSETTTEIRQNIWNNSVQVTENQTVKDSDPREKERYEIKPMTTPPYSLRVFPGCGAKRGTQAEPRGLPKLGRQIWECGGTKVTRDSWSEYQRGQRCTMREFCDNLPKVPLKHLGEYWSKHLWQ